MDMTRDNWTIIRDAITRDISSGELSSGDQLPTETQLADRFEIGRHSVRRALEALARDGKISIEQGRGTFVAETPRLTYQIGKRTRLRRNLIPQGVDVTSQLLSAKRINAPEEIAQALHLNSGAKLLESRRITLANDMPVAFGSAYHCAERFPDFAERRDILGSTTKTYLSFGIEDYVRQHTSIYARPAKLDEAKTLKQHADVPVLVVSAVDATLDGTPISTSRVIWSAARVTFTMEQSDG
jgi:GntR family phosphonate transport system transcriptional regulator